MLNWILLLDPRARLAMLGGAMNETPMTPEQIAAALAELARKDGVTIYLNSYEGSPMTWHVLESRFTDAGIASRGGNAPTYAADLRRRPYRLPSGRVHGRCQMSARELPPGLKSPPDGMVYLGLGRTFPCKRSFMGAIFDPAKAVWRAANGLRGLLDDRHYAAPADSEIARLNGYGAPAEVCKESEAVALVRKLAIVLDDLMATYQPDAPHDSHSRVILKEAAAFLAKEAKK